MIGVHKFIVAIDPGKHTGICVYDRVFKEVIRHDTILDGYNSYLGIYKELSNVNPYDTMVIAEQNHGKMTTNDQFDMCRKVGYIEGYCEINNLHLILQSPGSRTGVKRLAKDYFKRHFPGTEEHPIDAFAHILAYISKREGIKGLK